MSPGVDFAVKHHGRYDYSPITQRAPYAWPEGKRLAFYIALNIEHFSFGEGLGHTPSYATPQPDVRNYAWRDYGLRVGIWRLFDDSVRQRGGNCPTPQAQIAAVIGSAG